MEKLKQINIILSSLTVLLYISCKNVNEIKTPTLNIEFKKQANLLIDEKKDSLVINFAQFTEFSWDILYIFKPYTTIKTIDSIIGFEWDGAKESLINQSDEFNLLVFIENNAVIQSIKVPRNYGDFIKLQNNGPFDHDNAIFILKQENYGQQKWLFFYKK